VPGGATRILLGNVFEEQYPTSSNFIQLHQTSANTNLAAAAHKYSLKLARADFPVIFKRKFS
jgi:hypothetical protein